jgi:hypothetical protein
VRPRLDSPTAMSLSQDNGLGKNQISLPMSGGASWCPTCVAASEERSWLAAANQS